MPRKIVLTWEQEFKVLKIVSEYWIVQAIEDRPGQKPHCSSIIIIRLKSGWILLWTKDLKSLSIKEESIRVYNFQL